MKAIVLAAGYATRLRPLTDSIPKHLLPVGGRPMLDWVVERIERVPDVDGIHLVTNDRYAESFERWEGARSGSRVVVHNDGTSTNDDRLGAIGDIQLTVEGAGLEGDDLLIVAGDNLFEFGLEDLVTYWRQKGRASALAVHDVGDLILAREYGIVALDAADRVVSFVEKPADPPSTLAATATYVYHREHVPLVGRYLTEGNPPDQPGNFVAWLQEREPVYGYRFTGDWYDIGTPPQLLEADNRLRRRNGLPERRVYSPEEESAPPLT